MDKNELLAWPIIDWGLNGPSCLQALSGQENALLRSSRQFSAAVQSFVEDLLSQDLAIEALVLHQFSVFVYVHYFRQLHQQHVSIKARWDPLGSLSRLKRLVWDGYTPLPGSAGHTKEISYLKLRHLLGVAKAQRATFVVYAFAQKRIQAITSDHLLIWVVTATGVEAHNMEIDRRHLRNLLRWCTDYTGTDEEANAFRRAFLEKLGRPRNSTHFKVPRAGPAPPLFPAPYLLSVTRSPLSNNRPVLVSARGRGMGARGD